MIADFLRVLVLCTGLSLAAGLTIENIYTDRINKNDVQYEIGRDLSQRVRFVELEKSLQRFGIKLHLTHTAFERLQEGIRAYRENDATQF